MSRLQSLSRKLSINDKSKFRQEANTRKVPLLFLAPNCALSIKDTERVSPFKDCNLIYLFQSIFAANKHENNVIK